MYSSEVNWDVPKLKKVLQWHSSSKKLQQGYRPWIIDLFIKKIRAPHYNIDRREHWVFSRRIWIMMYSCSRVLHVPQMLVFFVVGMRHNQIWRVMCLMKDAYITLLAWDTYLITSLDLAPNKYQYAHTHQMLIYLIFSIFVIWFHLWKMTLSF